jgi:hypothetical protein
MESGGGLSVPVALRRKQQYDAVNLPQLNSFRTESHILSASVPASMARRKEPMVAG